MVGGWLLNWTVVFIQLEPKLKQKHGSPTTTTQFSLQTDIVYLEWATAGEMIVITASPSLRCSVSLLCVVPPWLY